MNVFIRTSFQVERRCKFTCNKGFTYHTSDDPDQAENHLLKSTSSYIVKATALNGDHHCFVPKIVQDYYYLQIGRRFINLGIQFKALPAQCQVPILLTRIDRITTIKLWCKKKSTEKTVLCTKIKKKFAVKKLLFQLFIHSNPYFNIFDERGNTITNSYETTQEIINPYLPLIVINTDQTISGYHFNNGAIVQWQKMPTIIDFDSSGKELVLQQKPNKTGKTIDFSMYFSIFFNEYAQANDYTRDAIGHYYIHLRHEKILRADYFLKHFLKSYIETIDFFSGETNSLIMLRVENQVILNGIPMFEGIKDTMNVRLRQYSWLNDIYRMK
uniref:Uncharacterized protein n=1 Tax=Panagrolaimus sp. JU765 TaxID=591449 RepID=A0AC34QVS7_9BILA